jgi:hypothetical protein
MNLLLIAIFLTPFVIVRSDIDCTAFPGPCYGIHYNDFGAITSCSVSGTMALTFDDGPGTYSDYILDALKTYNFKATFFTIGKKITGDGVRVVQRELLTK